MRHECFSQIGSRKINSDIHGANSWVQRVNIRFQGANIRFQGTNFRFRDINSEFRGCACVFYGVSSGAGRALMFCGVKNSFYMRAEQ